MYNWSATTFANHVRQNRHHGRNEYQAAGSRPAASKSIKTGKKKYIGTASGIASSAEASVGRVRITLYTSSTSNGRLIGADSAVR